MRKPTICVSTRFDTNRTVQSQKMVMQIVGIPLRRLIFQYSFRQMKSLNFFSRTAAEILNCIQESVVNPSSASRIEKNIINARLCICFSDSTVLYPSENNKSLVQLQESLLKSLDASLTKPCVS